MTLGELIAHYTAILERHKNDKLVTVNRHDYCALAGRAVQFARRGNYIVISVQALAGAVERGRANLAWQVQMRLEGVR